MSAIRVFYNKMLCGYVPVTQEFYPKNSNFVLYSSNIVQKCEGPSLSIISDYRVFLGLLTWPKPDNPFIGIGTFEIKVFKANNQILGALGNFDFLNKKVFFTDYFGGNTAAADPIIYPTQPNDIANIITIKNNILIDKNTYAAVFSYECLISPELSTNQNFNVRNIKLVISLQGNQNPPTNTTNLIQSINKKLADDNVSVYIETQTDKLGLNLGEMYCSLTSDHFFPNGYPQKYIGTCIGYKAQVNEIKNTFYSFKPNLRKVLKCHGDTLFEQTKNINNKYNANLTDCQFYYNILAYSTLRYIFAGLSNNSVFSLRWLCSSNYEQFLINLANSEFSAAVPLFTKPQPEYGFDFSNYNRYYRSCNCKQIK